MDKKIVPKLLLLVVIIAVILCFLFLDEVAAQLVSIMAIVVGAAWLFSWSMDHSAIHTILISGSACALYAPVLKFFSDTEFADLLSSFYNRLLTFFCEQIGKEVPLEFGSQSALAITFWLCVFLIRLVLPTMLTWLKNCFSAPSADQEQVFPEKNYEQKRKSFCKVLARRIDAINSETNWNEDTFTPIDAEVEATVNRRKKRRYEDLHKCLRRHRGKNAVFLVLGDPGSGKSVSMRKLCADMLAEADKTDLIPVYVDLKKWKEDWSLERLPTEADLAAFVLWTLREGGASTGTQTSYTDAFLDKYFQSMLEWGKWYFIFDSFDEMPCLMGRNSCQELIDHISALLHTFLTREHQHGGIIASRLFRAPTDELQAAIKLKLQPFSDVKIKRMLKLYTHNSDVLVRDLFGSREDLVSLCRNPFYLALLIEYSMNHGADLPKNQMALYKDFVRSRLERCKGRIEEEGLTVCQVQSAARQLARYMQESNQYGLECPASALYLRQDGYNWNKILELLRYAKLCRFGGASSAVSFVHRRFQECFYVTNLLERSTQLDQERYSDIEKNTGIRDALVLYCEIAPLEKAREIADHCLDVLFENIDSSFSILAPGCVELVNTLYFMAEAFRNRRDAMAEHQELFQRYAIAMVRSPEFIVRHAAVSSMVLFEQPQLLQMVLKVLDRKNRWLSDVVMRNCRTIAEIPWEISHKMAQHIAAVDSKTFFRQFFGMDFSLSLSRQLRHVRLVHAVRFVYELLCQISVKLVFPVLLAWGFLFAQQFDTYALESGLFFAIVAMLVILFIRMFSSIFNQYSNTFAFSDIAHLVSLAASVFMAASSGIMWLVIPLFVVSIVYAAVLWGIEWIRRIRKITRQDLASFPEVCRKGITSVRKFLLEDIPAFLKSEKDRKYFLQSLCKVLILFACIGLAYILPDDLDSLGYILFIGTELTMVFGDDIRNYLRQWWWLRHQPPVNTISRSVLKANLEQHLPDDEFKMRYLETLVERKVTLTDEWPENEPPWLIHDDADRLLAILECADIPNLHTEF